MKLMQVKSFKNPQVTNNKTLLMSSSDDPLNNMRDYNSIDDMTDYTFKDDYTFYKNVNYDDFGNEMEIYNRQKTISYIIIGDSREK